MGSDVYLLKALKLQRNIENYTILSSAFKNFYPDVDYKEDFITTKVCINFFFF